MKPLHEFCGLRALEAALLALSNHSKTIRTAREKWIASTDYITEQLKTEEPKLTPALPGLSCSQRDIWFGLESFLTAWSRTSLVFIPSDGSSERSDYLKGVLNVNRDHPIADRNLRNHWMHFDERLDSALVGEKEVTPYRFVSCVGESRNLTLCEIAVDPLVVTFLGIEPIKVLPLLDIPDRLLSVILERVGAIDFSTT